MSKRYIRNIKRDILAEAEKLRKLRYSLRLINIAMKASEERSAKLRRKFHEAVTDEKERMRILNDLSDKD